MPSFGDIPTGSKYPRMKVYKMYTFIRGYPRWPKTSPNELTIPVVYSWMFSGHLQSKSFTYNFPHDVGHIKPVHCTV